MARILIVDDERSIRRTLGEFLRVEGHDVAEAPDAEAALQLLGDSAFDIIVTDIIMPRVTGVELLHRLRAVAPDAQVIMMTGEPTAESATETLRAGAVDYLFKPITKADILRVVTHAVRTKTLAEAKRRLEEQNLGYQRNLEELVSERTRQLRASEQRSQELSRFNQAVLDALAAHICVLDEQGAILAVNRAWRDFASANPPLTSNAGPGANYLAVCDAVVGDNSPAAREAAHGLRAVISGELPEFTMEYPCHSPAEERWFMMRATRFAGEGPARVVVAHHPITERKRAEQALQASEEQFRAVVESGPIGIFIQTRGRFAYVNRFAANLFGAEGPEDLVGKEVLERIHPAFHTLVQKRLELLSKARQPVPLAEEHLLRLDGSVLEAEVAAVPFLYRNESGALVFFRDIADRKRLELELRQAAKMEAIGQLAGGVAHDFNNVLAAVLLHLGLIQQNEELPAMVRDSLREVEQETMRAASLTRRLLVFSRRQTAKTEILDLNVLVAGLLTMLRRLLGEHIEIALACAPAPVIVSADAAMLEQVVTNLCINARDAMGRGGSLRVATAIVEVDAKLAAKNPSAKPGPYACLSVADTGSGIAPEVLEKIFDPFFTTKPVGKGTGLGLAIVYGIARQHQGWVDVVTEVGRGSTFRVYLPALVGVAPPSSSPTQARSVKGGSEGILLVEDELALRRSAALALRKLGYAVIEAANGPQALEQWDQHRQRIALLLTDQVMPGAITGRELAARLRQDKPELKVILSTGYSEELDQLRAVAEEGFSFLSKPYQAQLLAEMVRGCLDEGQPQSPMPS